MSHTAPLTVYSGRATNWPMIWLSIAVMVPFLWMARGSGDSWTNPGLLIPVLVMVAAAALNALTASSVRTVAGPNGVTVHFGAFGWPRFHYPLERIATAEAVQLPVSIWSWGIYWSPRRGLMLTLRSGTALRLVLTNGRKVTISTSDAEAAVAAIDLARRPAAG
ncbi:MAG: hypothetical protein ABMA25_02390 [Ilumatobacteraceae bacterium]